VLNVDLFNGTGSESWPLSYAVMAVLLGNSTGYNGDCTNVQELVKLLSWTMVNDRAASALASTGFFPLTIVYFKRAVDLVGRINCGGERALSAAYLIGQGTTLQAINDWVQAYSSNSFVLKVLPCPWTLTLTVYLNSGSVLPHQWCDSSGQLGSRRSGLCFGRGEWVRVLPPAARFSYSHPPPPIQASTCRMLLVAATATTTRESEPTMTVMTMTVDWVQ